MVSVMNSDFDSERNPVMEEPRVSNDGDLRKDMVGDLNVKEETQVSTGDDMGAQKSEIDETRVSTGDEKGAMKCEIDETRVSSGPGQVGDDDARVFDVGSNHQVNGDSGDLDKVRVSSGHYGVLGDGEVELVVEDAKKKDAENQVVAPEEGADSSDDRTGGPDPLGSPSASNSDATGDDAMSQKTVCSHYDLMNDVNQEYMAKKRSDLLASVSTDGGAGSLDNVVRAGSLKVSGSAFEMGDMVWGKVKSHPWWPGHIYNEAFASNSVRRSRRDGYILVAFFGDSSYGWFDPTELIPYEPHYAEKSQQTNSRNFMNAVEESVDEASRRSALGLSCRCRNPNNFRPASVPGHMVVDVPDYEPGAIYSASQIQKARESFRPPEILSFIKQLAAMARSDEIQSFDLIKHKAAALAYRKSIFQEFDETYAQAFGQQPVRPSPKSTAEIDKGPSRAPLSGPLVIAEALGGRKSSNKATKSKELSKKDKYLFKRRDEAGNMRTTQTAQAHGSSKLSSAYDDGTSDSAAASYVLQKRDKAVSVKDESGGAPLRDPVAASPRAMVTKDIPTAGLGPGVSAKRASVGTTSGPQQPESGVVMSAVGSDMHGQVPDSHIGGVSSSDGGHLDMSGGPVKKKKKAKRSVAELDSEKPNIPDKKTKKLRKTNSEQTSVHLETPSSGSVGSIKPAGKPMQTFASSAERKDAEATGSLSQQVGFIPLGAVEGREDQLPELLADLLGLALNPFHGVERNRPAIVRQFFLKFRSRVYLKSSSASPAESESGDGRAVRSPLHDDGEKNLTVSGKSVPSLKQSKLSVRHDNPTKGGRKRIPSERQEEIAAKRAKKITDVKSLATEKRALLKNPEMQQVDGKVKVASIQQSPSRPTKSKTEQHLKKVDRPPRVEEPTYLVMKFQSGSSLPSLMELKARFARFGPLDTSLSRVFYKTNTCRVAFLYKQDAHVAYRYAVGSKSVFSNVKFMLKPVAELQQPSSVKIDDILSEPASNRDSSTAEPRPALSAAPLLPQQPVQQLKSILKKPSGNDEPGGPNNGSGSVKATRVRFNMGKDKGAASSNRPGVQVQLQMSDSRNANLSSESGPSSSSSPSSVAMDNVSNNQSRFISSRPLQPPLLPTPPLPPAPPFLRPPPINHPHQHHVELPPRNNQNYNVSAPLVQTPAPPPPPGMDISQQMMSLLTRCQEVVTNVRSVLGYVPYHSL